MSSKKILTSAIAISGSKIFRLFGQFFVLPILAKYLSPADYGVIAMSMPVIFFSTIFADAGLGQSLLRRENRDRLEWSTCYWLTILIGLVLTALVAISGPIFAWFYNEPRLTLLITALSPGILLLAATTIPQAKLQFEKRFGAVAFIETFSTIISFTAAIYCATHDYGAWALVAQFLTMHFFRTLGISLISKFKIELKFDLSTVKEHLIFGKGVIGSSITTFLTNSVDVVIIGRMLGSTILGFYTMTLLFVRLGIKVVTGPLLYVIYSFLAKRSSDTVFLRDSLLSLTRLLNILIIPGIGLVAVAHEPIFTVLLDEKWSIVGDLFFIAAPAAAYQTVQALRGTFLMAVGRTDVIFRINIEYFILFILFIFIASFYDTYALIYAYVASVFIHAPRSLALCFRHIDCSKLSYIKTFLLPTFITLAAAILYYESLKLIELEALGKIVLISIIFVLTVTLLLFLQKKTIRNDIMNFK